MCVYRHKASQSDLSLPDQEIHRASIIKLLSCLSLFAIGHAKTTRHFGCFLFLSAGIEANCLFFFFSLVFFFFFSLSLSIPHSPFFLSLFPFFVDFPHNLFFFFFFLFIIYFYFFPFFFLSLSCFLCPLVLSVTVWLSKRVYKIKLINIKKKKKKKR